MRGHNHYSHNNLHKSHDFRKNKNKKFLIVLAIVVIIALVLAKDIGGIKTTIKEKSNEIKESGQDNIIAQKQNEITPRTEELETTLSCAMLKMIGESEGVTNMKKKECIIRCGKNNMDYDSNKCVKDKLYCYCLE